MSLTIQDQAPLAGLKIPPYKPTQAQARKLQKVANQIERLDAQIHKASDLKGYRAELHELLANGEADLHDVGPMLYLIDSASSRNEMATALRSPIKQAVKTCLEGIRDVLEAERDHQLAFLQDLISTTEKRERDTLKAAGVDQDMFQQSAVLAQMTESHRRIRDNPLNLDRGAVARLIASRDE